MKHKIMKKRMAAFFLMISMMVSSTVTAYAAPGSTMSPDKVEMEKQERIDKLFEELNRLDVEKAYDCRAVKNAVQAENSADAEGLAAGMRIREESYAVKEKKYEAELEKLGVHKVEPSNPEDMAMLEAMRQDMALGNDGISTAASGGIYDTAPDFSMIANVYTLYIYDGTYRDYEYRYIIVRDNKGYNKLYYYQDNNLAVNIGASAVSSVLNYNFGYAVSSLLGLLPYGMVLDWTLGNLFSALSGVDASVVSSGQENFYGVRHNGVTEMTYYYIYNNGWRHIGTSGSAEVIRTDYFYGNVNGSPVSENPKTNFTIRSRQNNWWAYIDNYVQAASAGRPNYCNIDNFGKITIKGYNGRTYYYAPAFAETPNDLL